jgi:TolB protein
MDIDGGDVRQLTSADSYDGRPTFSPDGRWVVYQSHEGEKTNLRRVPVGGGDSARLTEVARATRPAVSPDGKLIACLFSETQESTARLALVPFDGGKPVKLLDLSATALPVLRWMPDNRTLAFVDTKDGASNVWALPTDGSKPRQLTDFTSGQIYSFDLARDGRPTLFSRGVTNKDVVLITGFK